MTCPILHALSRLVTDVADPLHELLRQGARDLIGKAVKAELAGFLVSYDNERLEDVHMAIVRNGYLPSRTVGYRRRRHQSAQSA